MSKNNNLVLFIVLALVLIFGIYCVIERNPTDGGGDEKPPAPSQRKSKKPKQNPPDIEYLGGSDSNDSLYNNLSESDAFELLGVASNDPALQLQMGMGPGLYGSGRHTSEMIGN